jgi:hypothetical protein
MHVSAEPVELSDDNRNPFAVMAGIGERGLKLRPTVERVGALPRLDLDKLGLDREPLGLGESGDGGPLRLEAETRAALFCG